MMYRCVAITGSVVLLLALSLLSTGCASSASAPRDEYETLENAPRRDTERARSLNAQAVQAMDGEQYEQAERLLKQALTFDVTFGPAHNNLGKVYYHTDRYYLAAWEFEYAAKRMPYQPEPRNNLGLVLERVGKLDDAIEQFTQAAALAPDNPQLIGNLARARVRRGDRGPEMRELLTQLVLKDTRPDWLDWAKSYLHRVMPIEP